MPSYHSSMFGWSSITELDFHARLKKRTWVSNSDQFFVGFPFSRNPDPHS